jgi:hypothetical protein
VDAEVKSAAPLPKPPLIPQPLKIADIISIRKRASHGVLYFFDFPPKLSYNFLGYGSWAKKENLLNL